MLAFNDWGCGKYRNNLKIIIEYSGEYPKNCEISSLSSRDFRFVLFFNLFFLKSCSLLCNAAFQIAGSFKTIYNTVAGGRGK